MKELVVNKPAVAAFKARHRLTDEDIASRMGVAYGSWIRWLSGKNAIPAWALLALADVMGADPRDLMEERRLVTVPVSTSPQSNGGTAA